jgi:hypothetical protein
MIVPIRYKQWKDVTHILKYRYSVIYEILAFQKQFMLGEIAAKLICPEALIFLFLCLPNMQKLICSPF